MLEKNLFFADPTLIWEKEKLKEYFYKINKQEQPPWLDPRDVTGEWVVRHAEPEDREDEAAHKLQTVWRQRSRASDLHSQAQLFGQNGPNTTYHYVTLPPQFVHLSRVPIPPLFTTTTHGSPHLMEILHDGAIYSRKITRIKGAAISIDKARGDNALTFTSPYDLYGLTYVTMNVRELVTFNSGRDVYFKFNNWIMEKELKFFITLPGSDDKDKIWLLFQYGLPTVRCRFFRNNTPVTEVELSSALFVYQGYEGLDKYLTFFIFKILEALPPEQNDLKSAIYTYFASLPVMVLISHLQTQMRAILYYCELDFLSKIKFNMRMIENITVLDKIYDFNKLREDVIKSDDLDEFCHMLADEQFRTMLSQSYFLVRGILDYALEQRATKLCDFVQKRFAPLLAFQQEYQGYKERLQLLRSIPRKILEDINKIHPSDITRMLRSAYFIFYALDMLQKYAIPELRGYFDNLNVLKLLKCYLFRVSDERSEDASVSKPACSDMFYDYFKDKPDYSPEELERYRKALVEGDDPNGDPIRIIMIIANQLNLSNSRSQEKLNDAIRIVYQYVNHNCPLKDYLTFARRCVLVTGCAFFVALKSARQGPKMKMEDIQTLGKNFDKCIEVLAEVVPTESIKISFFINKPKETTEVKSKMFAKKTLADNLKEIATNLAANISGFASFLTK